MTRANPRQSFICLRCLARSRRSYATTTGPQSASLPPAPPASGASRLTNRRLISLNGQDAPKFLQGIITNNLRRDSHTGFFAAFLTAQGKVLHDVFVYPTAGSQLQINGTNPDEPGYIVEVDAPQASKLLAHLKRHKLRAKLQLRLLEEGEIDVWSAWKEEEKWTPHPSNFAGDIVDGGEVAHGGLSLVDTRASGMGRRILLSPSLSNSSSLMTQPSLASLEEVPISAYTIRRYLRGVAEGQDEIPRDNAYPMNTNIDLMGGIDFKKGCYVGQELTIRTHHTGVVRRRILPVTLFDSASGAPDKPRYDPGTTIAAPAHDTDIKIEGKRGKPGKWIAGVGNIGLAMCRLEMMTDLIVTGEPSQFSADDRFTIKVGEEGSEQAIGVKAFVPDWVRGKIRVPKVQKRVE